MSARQEDRFLPAGTKVRLDALVNGEEDVSEYGVVVHCWRDADIDFWDCYVAFFGQSWPEGQPDEKPYILRYAAGSLMPLND